MARQPDMEVVVLKPFSAGTGRHCAPGARVSGDPRVLARLVGMHKARWVTAADGPPDVGPPEVTANRSTRAAR